MGAEEGGPCKPDPLQGREGGKMDSIPGNPLGQGTVWGWRHTEWPSCF